MKPNVREVNIEDSTAINTEVRREALKGRYGSFKFEGKSCFGVKKPVLLKQQLTISKPTKDNPAGRFIENPFDSDTQYRDFLQNVVAPEISNRIKGVEIVVFVPGVPMPEVEEYSFRITVIGLSKPGPLSEESQHEKFYNDLGEIYMMFRKYIRAHARDVSFDPTSF